MTLNDTDSGGTQLDYDDDEAYCTEFTTDHESLKSHHRLDSCGPSFALAVASKNGLEGEPEDFKNRPFRCTSCNWVSLLVAEAIEEFEQSLDRTEKEGKADQ